MPLELRPAAIADLRVVADLETRVRPQEPVDPPTLKYHTKHPTQGRTHRHLVVAGEALIGTATFRHPEGAAWGTDRATYLSLSLVPEAGAAAPEALRLLEELARADHPKLLSAWSFDTDTYLNDAYVGAGYRHDRTGIAQELDLVAGRDRLLGLREQTRARMADQRVTLRHAGGEPLERFRGQLLRLVNQTQQDVPHSVDEPDLDEPTIQTQLTAPSAHLDRLWTAWDAERLVAISFLDFPVERGHFWTGFTACDRDYRRRGLAQAVKNETVGQAIELGLPRIRTDNDTENEPMLAINRKLGYVPIYEIWEWLKKVG